MYILKPNHSLVQHNIGTFAGKCFVVFLQFRETTGSVLYCTALSITIVSRFPIWNSSASDFEIKKLYIFMKIQTCKIFRFENIVMC